MDNFRRGDTQSFEDYLQFGQFPHNHYRYTDANDRLLVDRVLKFETLNEDLSEIFSNLGVPFTNKKLEVQAKSSYRKNKTSYRDIYTPEQATIIEEAFAKELKMHKYEY